MSNLRRLRMSSASSPLPHTVTLYPSCSSMLQHEGYNVTVCGKGEEALDILKRRKFDIVLLDLYMSQVPGMELLRAALETHPDPLAIVMTGNPSVASSVEALRAGARSE